MRSTDVLSVVACAGNTTSPAPSEPDTAAAFPVTITHKPGSTVVPAEPTRVVALGGAPAMTGYFNATDGHAPWLASKLGTAQVEILTGGGGENSEAEVPLEKVAGHRPIDPGLPVVMDLRAERRRDRGHRRRPDHPGHTTTLRQFDGSPRSSDNLAETFAIAPAKTLVEEVGGSTMSMRNRTTPEFTFPTEIASADLQLGDPMTAAAQR